MNTASEAMKKESPTHGEKREHPDTREEKDSRRVLQRIDDSSKDNNNNDSMMPPLKQIVLDGLNSPDEANKEKAMNQLCTILENNDDSNEEDTQREFINLGGLDGIVRAMLLHSNCKSIQEGGIKVFWLVAYENRVLLNDVIVKDGIQVILAAMKMFESDSSVQFCGLKALYKLLWHDEKVQAAHAKLVVLNLDGASHVVETLSKFNDECVVYEACEFLRVLCLSTTTVKKHIFDAGAVTALAAIIDGFNEATLIRKSASEAMSSLMEYSKSAP